MNRARAAAHPLRFVESVSILELEAPIVPLANRTIYHALVAHPDNELNDQPKYEIYFSHEIHGILVCAAFWANKIIDTFKFMHVHSVAYIFCFHLLFI